MGRLSVFLSFALLLLTTHVHAGSGAPKSLTLIIKAPSDTAPHDRLFVTGSSNELCFWKTDCVELKPIGYKTYKVEIPFSAQQASVEFKITRGNWDREAVKADGSFAPNHFVQLRPGNHPLVITVEAWKDGQHLGVTGNLETFSNFYSPQLKGNKTVRIWLPAGYSTHSPRRYPVIYMHDGQNVFDPKTSTYGSEWGIDETLTRLMNQSKTAGAIVVAIDCAENREEEYDFQRNGELYARFLIETLKPWVDQNYKTLRDRKHTLTMGSSMGALVSLGLLWNHSDVFSGAGAISLPAFYGTLASWIIHSGPIPRDVQLYIDHGDYGGDEDYVQPGKAFIQELEHLGFPREQLRYLTFSYADHHESDWARRVELPLLWLLELQDPQTIYSALR